MLVGQASQVATLLWSATTNCASRAAVLHSLSDRSHLAGPRLALAPGTSSRGHEATPRAGKLREESFAGYCDRPIMDSYPRVPVQDPWVLYLFCTPDMKHSLLVENPRIGEGFRNLGVLIGLRRTCSSCQSHVEGCSGQS